MNTTNIHQSLLTLCTLTLLGIGTATAATPVFKAGTTATGAPGTAASLSVKKAGNTIKFNFTIPQGQKGDSGTPGPQGPVGSFDSASIPAGSITSVSLAAGSVDASKLAKPPQSGTITNSNLPASGNGAFTIIFPLAYTTSPIVTLSASSQKETQASVQISNVTATGFTGRVSNFLPGLLLGEGNGSSLAIVNGNPAIVSNDFGFSNAQFIRANDSNGTSWGSFVNIGISVVSNMAVINGNPAAVGVDASHQLQYVRANNASGSVWGTPWANPIDVGDGVGTYLGLVSGNPAIAYASSISTQVNGVDGVVYTLYYVRASDINGTSWGTPVVCQTYFLSDAALNGGNIQKLVLESLEAIPKPLAKMLG